MPIRHYPLFLNVLIFAAFSVDGVSQVSRASVSANEVNGTYRSYFSGRYRGSFSEIRLLSIGRGKLRFSMDLIYPYTYGKGELMANTGQLDGVAAIHGDEAIYSSDEGGECRIKIKFVRPGTIRVKEDDGSICRFGQNVTADGSFKKVTGTKPKFPKRDL